RQPLKLLTEQSCPTDRDKRETLPRPTAAPRLAAGLNPKPLQHVKPSRAGAAVGVIRRIPMSVEPRVHGVQLRPASRPPVFQRFSRNSYCVDSAERYTPRRLVTRRSLGGASVRAPQRLICTRMPDEPAKILFSPRGRPIDLATN